MEIAHCVPISQVTGQYGRKKVTQECVDKGQIVLADDIEVCAEGYCVYSVSGTSDFSCQPLSTVDTDKRFGVEKGSYKCLD